MKKLLVTLLILSTAAAANAQSKNSKDSKDNPKKKPNIDWANRASDHFMMQFGADSWSNKPDSVKTKGFSRHFNFYIMLDKPFKNNPKFSVAYGLGLGTSNIFFDKKYVDIKANAATLPFRNSYPGTDSGYFDKFKLTTIFLEAPVELRYYSNPENPSKSWKAAIGVKIGTLLKSYTKGKDLQNKAGQSLYGNKFIEKDYSKKYFNTTKLAVDARVGYGIWGLHFGYQITSVFKDGFGPDVHPFSVGLTVSGL